MSGAAETGDSQAAVDEMVGRALGLMLPMVLRIIDNHIDARLAGSTPLFDWRGR